MQRVGEASLTELRSARQSLHANQITESVTVSVRTDPLDPPELRDHPLQQAPDDAAVADVGTPSC
jgi:hypothetical protein